MFKLSTIVAWGFLTLATSYGQENSTGQSLKLLNKTVEFGVILAKAPTVDFKNVVIEDYNGKEYIMYAKARFHLNMEPRFCNADFLEDEIIVDVSTEKGADRHLNYSTTIKLGTVEELNVYSTCSAVFGPRPGLLELEVANGIGRYADKERLLDYEFEAGSNEYTGTPDKWIVTIAVNQAEKKLEVRSIVKKTDAPNILKNFKQVLECDMSGVENLEGIPADESAKVTIIKNTDEIKAFFVGKSQVLFGDKEVRSLTMSNSDSPYGVEFSANLESSRMIRFNSNVRALGWESKDVMLDFSNVDESKKRYESDDNRYTFASCRTISISPL